jgi:NAD(P)-dependent dehydrogenase (short-subunit alcohol dehydrogenase family)
MARPTWPPTALPRRASRTGVKSIACEYGKDGIRMNMVSPGENETAATAALPSENGGIASST